VAEYLSEEEQLAQLKGWWQRYGWWLIAGVVLGLGGYFVLQYLESTRAANNAAASEVFERYQEDPANDDVAKPLLARLDGEFSGTAYHIMSLMTRAQLASDAGDIEAAVGFYSQATDTKEVEHITDVARLRLARALQQQGRGDEAISALGNVSGEGYRSLVAELKGDILLAKGDKSGARDAYSAAVDAQGENPRTLLSMKLKNLTAPGGGVVASETETETEIETATTTETLNEGADPESETVVESMTETVETAVDNPVETVVDTISETVSDIDSQLDAQLTEPLEPSLKPAQPSPLFAITVLAQPREACLRLACLGCWSSLRGAPGLPMTVIQRKRY